MDQELVLELLENKARKYEAQGRDKALRLAVRDILAAARGRLAAAELFCLRLALRGAMDELDADKAPPEPAGAMPFLCLLPRADLRG